VRFLIAPDKFKGSLRAREVAGCIALGIRDVLPDAEIDIAPVADGGEGTAEVIRAARGGEWVDCAAHDALGREITARYVWIADAEIAVLEVSEAAGLARIAPADRDVIRSNTFGVGEMILHAAKRGPREIIIGLGGSATNDGGFGMSRALGFRFFGTESEDRRASLPGGRGSGQAELGRSIWRLAQSPRGSAGASAYPEGALDNGPADLVGLTRIVQPATLRLPRIRAAADVRNPLLGPRGATRVFSPQKGATPEAVELLERALANLAEIAARDLGIDHRDAIGAGAAGGLGYGLLTFCTAIIVPGFDVVADAMGLASKVEAADIVITGEGKLDRQTREGKAPAGVAELARKNGKRVFAIVGTAESGTQDLFDGVSILARPPISRTVAIKLTAELLRERAKELARSLNA